MLARVTNLLTDADKLPEQRDDNQVSCRDDGPDQHHPHPDVILIILQTVHAITSRKLLIVKLYQMDYLQFSIRASMLCDYLLWNFRFLTNYNCIIMSLINKYNFLHNICKNATLVEVILKVKISNKSSYSFIIVCSPFTQSTLPSVTC